VAVAGAGAVWRWAGVITGVVAGAVFNSATFSTMPSKCYI